MESINLVQVSGMKLIIKIIQSNFFFTSNQLRMDQIMNVTISNNIVGFLLTLESLVTDQSLRFTATIWVSFFSN